MILGRGYLAVVGASTLLLGLTQSACGGDDFSGETGGTAGAGAFSSSGAEGGGGSGGGTGGCTAGETEPCYSGPQGTERVGSCTSGTRTCDDSGAWGPCEGEVTPVEEVCQANADKDCNGFDCGDAMWSKIAGDSGAQYLTAVRTDSAGNVYVAGHFTGSIGFGGTPLVSAGGFDIFLAKLDPGGNELWSARFGDESDQLAFGMDVSGDRIAIVGEIEGTVSFGGPDVAAGGFNYGYLVTLGTDGSHLATTPIYNGFTDGISPRAVALRPDGSAVVGGSYTCFVETAGGGCLQPDKGNGDGFVASYAADGTTAPLWNTRFGDTSVDEVSSLALDASGNTWLLGSFEGTVNLGGPAITSAGVTDVLFAKLDPAGNVAMATAIGGSGIDRAGNVAVHSSGGVVLIASYRGTLELGGGTFTSAGLDDLLVVAATDGGDMAGISFGGSGSDIAGAIAIDSADNLVLSAFSEGPLDFGGGTLTGSGGFDVVVVGMSSMLEHRFSKRFGDDAYQRANALALTPKDELVIGGYVEGSIDFGNGTLTAIGTDEAGDVVVAKLAGH